MSRPMTSTVYERPDSRKREERALFDRLVQTGDDAARAALVERFLPLARSLARGYRGGEDIDDLEQVAAIGLMKAVDRFEPERGLAFTTYAMPTIVGELRRHYRDRTWSVRVPRAVYELAVRVERVGGELVGELGRSPTVAELAQRAGATCERVVEALEATGARHALSLDQPPEQVDGPRARGREVAVEEPGYAAVDDSVVLEQLMRVLAPRDRVILELRFHEDRLQAQIAEVMGISQMQVSRVIRSAIERLQRTAEYQGARAQRR